MQHDSSSAFALCLRLMAGELVVDGAVDELTTFRPLFDEAYEQVAREHGYVRVGYYRDADGAGLVNPLHSAHYARLLYAFSRRMRLAGAPVELLDQVFLAIKSRCAVDLFYDHDLPPFLLPLHPYGTVLGRCSYSPFLVVSQGCSIGGNRGEYPTLGKGVVLRPGSMVLGPCTIGDNVQIAAGALVINRDVPPNSIVFGEGRHIEIRPNGGDTIDEFFEADRLRADGLLTT